MVSKSVDPPAPANFIRTPSGVLQDGPKFLTNRLPCEEAPTLRNTHDGISDGIAATPEEGYRQLSYHIGREQREARARAVRAVLCALVEGIIIRQLPRTTNL
jgi:hypothetical protein